MLKNYSGDHLPPSLKPTCQREPHCLSTHKHAEWLVHGASTADSTGPVVCIDLTNDFKYFLGGISRLHYNKKPKKIDSESAQILTRVHKSERVDRATSGASKFVPVRRGEAAP